jgi:transcriptional regulator with XRE-family HTH domain
MKVTKDIQQKIIRALPKKGLNLSEFSEKLGKHRTWATKLLSKNSTIQELSQDTADQISDLLGIPLRPVQTIAGNVSHTAIELSRSAENDARIAQLLEIVFDLANPEPDNTAHIPVVETKELQRVGAEISKIVHRWEQPKGDYSPKIGAEVLDYLRGYFAKIESKGKK